MASAPPDRQIVIAEPDMRSALIGFGGEFGNKLAEHGDAIGISLDFLKAAHEGSRLGMASSAASLGNHIISSVKARQQTRAAVSGLTLVLNQADITIAAAAMMNLSPGRAAWAGGFLIAQKLGAISVMLPESEHNAQCVLAIMTLAGNAGMTLAAGIPTGGIGATLTLASLAAAGLNATLKCSDASFH